MTVEGEELIRRLKAAQALAGFESVDDIAARIGIEGLGRDTLRNMWRGKRAVRRHELREIAEACGVPLEFFTDDDPFVMHDGGAEDELRELRAAQAALAEQQRQLASDVAVLRDSMAEILMLFRRNPPAQVRQRKARAGGSGSS